MDHKAGIDIDIEESWRASAEAARECIRLLGYPVIMVKCMPGEEHAAGCGGSVSAHAVSYFVVLRTLADHYLSHLGPPEDMMTSIRLHALEDINCWH